MLSDTAREALRHYAAPRPETTPQDPRTINMLIREGYINSRGELSSYGRAALLHIGAS